MRPKLFAAAPGLAAALLLFAPAVSGQEPPAAPRPPEGPWIINLPSTEVPRAGTLSLLFTHRFSEDLRHGSLSNFYTFDSGADVGIGLSYAPIEKGEITFLRSRTLQDYELSGRYRILSRDPLAFALRAGANWRTEHGVVFDAVTGRYSRRGYFAQGILSAAIGSQVRVTAVPTYVSETSGHPLLTPKASYEDLFNVPVALAVRVTRTINVQAEAVPRYGRADSRGVAWIVAVEKTVLRHRFAFTVGNLRATTVDQYVASDFFGASPRSFYIGFNLVRQWKLK